MPSAAVIQPPSQPPSQPSGQPHPQAPGPLAGGPRPLPVQVLATGRHLPRQVVESAEFDRRWGLPEGRTERECGVARRHRAGPGETSASMGAAALRQALHTAGMPADALDCVISTTAVMQQAIPCLAAQIQAELGLGESGIPAFDINATCLSFLTGLDLAAAAIAVGRFRTVGLVASEIASVGLDPDDRATAPLFGDGAAAAILTAAPEGSASCLLAADMATYGVAVQACQLRAGGTAFPARAELPRHGFFEMDGKAVFRLARRHLPGFVERLLRRAQVAPHELACVVHTRPRVWPSTTWRPRWACRRNKWSGSCRASATRSPPRCPMPCTKPSPAAGCTAATA